MPVMDCAEQLILKYPDMKVIILTMHDNGKSIIHIIEIGLNSFLLKNSASKLYGYFLPHFWQNPLLGKLFS